MAKASLKEQEAKAKEKEAKALLQQRAREEKEKQKADKERVKAEKERARAEKERERVEKERVRAAREAELEAVKEQRRQLRLDAERKKLEADKEKSEREERDKAQRQARQQEKERRDRQADRSRNLLSSFLGVPPSKPKAADSVAVDAAEANAASAPLSAAASSADGGGSSTFSAAPVADDIAPLFHPFQPKPNTVMAAVLRVPPASADEIAFMDHSLHLSSASSSSSSPPSPSSSLRPVYLSPLRPTRRRAAFQWSRHPPRSRRSKLIQHHTSYRPPWWGFFPLSTSSVLPFAPFGRDSAVNYDVDSDEEWGNEPEGEELQSGDEGEEEEEKVGRIRADGYEEDGDFVVPEEEDEAARGMGAQVEGRLVEKGGVRRVVIRPVIRGPYKEGAELTADMRELLQWAWRLMDGPIDVVKRKAEDADRADAAVEATKKRAKPTADDALSDRAKKQKIDPPDAAAASAERKEAGGVAGQTASTESIKKRQERRTIVPQSASSLPLSSPSTADASMSSTGLTTPTAVRTCAAADSTSRTPVAPAATPSSPPPPSTDTSSVPPSTPPTMALKAAKESEERERVEVDSAHVGGRSEDGPEAVDLTVSELSTNDIETSEIDSELPGVAENVKPEPISA